jgi:RNA polymerase sigma-70 factor, ECF subfamily
MDRHAQFLKLFLAHQDGVRAFIFSMLRDRQAAEDAFQETALVLWREFERYDETRSFGAWARGIAANKVLKAREQDARRGAVLSPEAIQAVAAAYDKAEPDIPREQEALRGCLERLPEKSRKLLALRYEESLGLEELARRIESTLEAVHKSLVRTRAGLMKCVEYRLKASQGGVS